MTQKEKLEKFDAVKAERDTLSVALHSLLCPKFPFGKPVTVDASEVDARYKRGEERYHIRRADRMDPLYLVMDADQVRGSYEVIPESRMIQDGSMLMRILQEARFKLNQRQKETL